MEAGKVIARIRGFITEKLKPLPEFLNRFHPPGMKGAGLYDVMRFFVAGLSSPRFNLSAMAMSYRFFFAMFPALILLFTLIPLVPVDNLKAEVLLLLATVVPEDSLGFVYRIVDEFFSRPSAGVIYLNLGLLLYSAMSGIKVMMQAFTKDDTTFRKRGFLRQDLVALGIFVFLLTIFAVMLSLLISGEYLIKYLSTHHIITKNGFQFFLLKGLNILIQFLAMQVAVSVVYYFGPSLHDRWKFFSAGSIISGVLILLAITGFRLFFVNFADYNKIYGSLGAIMVMMVWFYWISIVLLIGFEMNAAIDRAFTEGKSLEAQLEEEEHGEIKGNPLEADQNKA